MSGYSDDLRERVVAARQAGRSQAWCAVTFEVSVSSVKRWTARYNEHGSVGATVQKRMQPRIGVGEYERLGALVARLPDATLVEYAAAWEQETGIPMRATAMGVALRRCGQTRKKRRSGRSSATK